MSDDLLPHYHHQKKNCSSQNTIFKMICMGVCQSHLLDAISCSQLDDGLGCLLVVVATIPTKADCLALHFVTQREEQGLDPANETYARLTI